MRIDLMRIRLALMSAALALSVASPLPAEAHSPILTVLKSKKKKPPKKECTPKKETKCPPGGKRKSTRKK